MGIGNICMGIDFISDIYEWYRQRSIPVSETVTKHVQKLHTKYQKYIL